MTCRKLLALFSLALWASLPARSQLWSGILDASRAIDWHAISPGASSIDEVRSQCGTTLAPLGVGKDDSTRINNAIAQCPPHQYVLLGAGTFTLASGIVFNGHGNVTLRGSGPLTTILQWTAASQGYNCLGFKGNICVINPGPSWFYGSTAVTPPQGSNQTNWTGGYAQGTDSITVANTVGLSVGMTLILDQMDDEVAVAASPDGARQSGNTVTITTRSPHGYSTGQSVYLGAVGAASIANSTGAVESGNTVTITTTTPHGLSVGQTACVGSVNVAGYNGSFAVTAVISSTQFQYNNSHTGLLNGGGGSADPCYSGGPYTITSVPSPTSFTYATPLSGLPASGGGEATVDTGGVWICDVPGACQVVDAGPYACRQVNSVSACQTQVVTITSISGKTVGISPALYATNWRASQSPGAWWNNATITGVGIENLTLDNHLDVSNIRGGIVLVNSTNSWIKNIRSIVGARNHVWVMQSAHITIRDSYFYGTLNASSQSYGVEDAVDGDMLIENNIFHYVTSPTIGAGGSGSVFGYNYSNTNYYLTPATVLSPVTFSHDAANVYKLYEGNDFSAIACDSFHGSTSADTFFRNWLTGWEAGKTGGTDPVGLDSFCRAMNFVGNVLGTPGIHATYQTDPTGLCTAASTIYHLGWSSLFCANTVPPSDPLVTRSLMRWGNYDVVTKAVQWNSSEVATMGMTFINGNPVPTTHNVPPSLYLTGKPPFWATPGTQAPWPAVGPDVIRGNGPAGLAYSNPAQICFTNTQIDAAFTGVGPGQALAFDASACYNQSLILAAPTNLTVTVR